MPIYVFSLFSHLNTCICHLKAHLFPSVIFLLHSVRVGLKVRTFLAETAAWAGWLAAAWACRRQEALGGHQREVLPLPAQRRRVADHGAARRYQPPSSRTTRRLSRAQRGHAGHRRTPRRQLDPIRGI